MRARKPLLAAVLAGLVVPAAAAAQGQDQPTPTSQLLHRDVIVGADLWDRRPRMMAAGLGFTNIIGVPGITTDDLTGSEATVRAVGGAWNTVSCGQGETPALNAYTSANTPQAVALTFGFPTTLSAGLPVEFSWPILPSTLGATDFRVTFNTGETVTPELAAVFPNQEYNERAVAVLFGKLGNRLPPSDPGAVYPVRTEVVRDATPLKLVGPRGRLASAVGMHAQTSTTPYDDPANHTGPHLVAAKVSRMSTAGEAAPKVFSQALPNDGVALYGSKAQWRVRVYTSGGFSPDGVRAMFPTEFGRYFRLRAHGNDGRDIVITKTGKTYDVNGHKLRVLGLADLGRKASRYDDCYTEDKDNQIDIVLTGDEAAVRQITDVEIPASGRYDPFYNPGGPGNAPTPGVRYSAPGPSQMQKVTQAIDDPMVVTYRPAR